MCLQFVRIKSNFQIISGVVSRKKFCALVFLFSLIYCVFTFLEYDEKFWNPAHPNYFLHEKNLNSAGFTVDTEACQIPNLSAMDISIIPYLKQSKAPSDCKRNRRWTYVLGSNVVLNLTAIKSQGYSLQRIDCCYRTISRVEQSLAKYDDKADAVINVSKECKPLKEEVNYVPSEFIRVVCVSKLWPFYQDVVYRNHHALVQRSHRLSTARKVGFWETARSKQSTPPNVLVIGIDSMSKLNFQRTMRTTRRALIEIGAVEMLGYTKVGENTFPNAVAFMSGYNESTLEKICYFTPLTAQDACPYIWKDFNGAQYLTAHLEDSPELNIFNRLKTGFVEQQVDFYLRPFMQDIFGPLHSKDCAGPDTIEEKTLNYIHDIANLSEFDRIPYFVFTWLTSLAHSDMSAAAHADHIFKDALKSLNLNNTILFFMSDHGFRYGTFRETFFGWFEDKLPNFWVYLPPTVKKDFPSWPRELISNSRKLLSPFDLYHTFRHILRTFAPEETNADGRESISEQRTYGHSMFENISTNRTCANAGIAPHFCPCATPAKIPLDSPELLTAAHTALNHINSLLPRQCSKLYLQKLTAGAVMKDRSSRERDYVVALLATPGSFLFEATVHCESVTGRCNIKGNVLRMNKISTDVSCVKDVELEVLCYCSSK